MARALYTNNAAATLASGITNVATTITLSSGQGSLFPTPSGGNYFYATLADAATKTVLEIVQCTARSGDTLTVVRGAQGSSSSAYITGDRLELRPTAYSFSELVAPLEVQSQTYTFSASTGSTNAYALTLSPNTSVPTDGFKVCFRANFTNTAGVSTLAIGGGTAYNIYLTSGSSTLPAGIITTSQDVTLTFNTSVNGWMLESMPSSLPAGVVALAAIDRTGAAGQVLTSNGASAATWATPSPNATSTLLSAQYFGGL